MKNLDVSKGKPYLDMFQRITQFLVKNNVISSVTGFIIALSLNDLVNSIVKDILIPGLFPFQETNPLYSFFVALFSLVLVVFIVQILLGEVAEKTLGMDKVEEAEKVKDKIKDKIVEKKVEEKVEEDPRLVEKVMNGELNQP